MYRAGRRNDFYLGPPARLIRKMRFCEFSKFLLYKSPILRRGRAPPGLGPRPCILSVVSTYNMEFTKFNLVDSANDPVAGLLI